LHSNEIDETIELRRLDGYTRAKIENGADRHQHRDAEGRSGETHQRLHLAAALAERGRRVLLWDVDENYGATKVLGWSDSRSTMDIVTGECRVDEAIVTSEDEDSNLPPNLALIRHKKSGSRR